MKTLNNTTEKQAKDQVSDLEVFGDGDSWKLLCKASSNMEGWMKSTKAYEIPGVGCMVQVTTQQRFSGGLRGWAYAVAEAVTFVPGVKIAEEVEKGGKGEVTARRLVTLHESVRTSSMLSG